MNAWQTTFFGLKQIPHELTAFEIEAFFTFTATERQVIEQRRRSALKLGLALQIGFLRMSGRLLDAVRIVPAVLWRHLGEQFTVAAPDLASLRAMYGRGNTLFEHQQLACEVLDFHWPSKQQRRALSSALRLELTRTRDRQQLLIFARRWLYEHRLLIRGRCRDWTPAADDIFGRLLRQTGVPTRVTACAQSRRSDQRAEAPDLHRPRRQLSSQERG